ncbi:hypothetical protein Pan216_26800 [Planctomycetes bacterium Pan216]|uniref:DUF3365 domain-containing protein n=1 Tax=Kolteria novifilia TaxID=2527975 RepID=A0A518B4B3_9BACT|nr:hypothetical protein Pan216_26800 [Planctomycetes bacterium Pan216]
MSMVMGRFAFSLVVSLVILGVVLLAACWQGKWRPFWVALGELGVLSVLWGFGPDVRLFAVSLVIVTGLHAGLGWRLRVLAPVSVMVLVGCFAYQGFVVSRRLEALAASRRTFPLVSVSERLAYERETSDLPKDQTWLQLSMGMRRRISDLERRTRRESDKTFYFYWLHDRAAEHFILSEGFGVTRMGPFKRAFRKGLPLAPNKDSKPMSLPEPESPERPYSPDTADDFAADLAESTLFQLHQDGVFDFVEPNSLGYAENRDHVVGFEPHHFREVPKVGKSFTASARNWVLTRLELVSLLKGDEPSVYVTKHLPRMDDLVDAPRRPLDAFETEALDKLRFEEDLVVEETESSVRMLGSLRAGENCLKCHHGRRGDLLGAFSYELRRKRPVVVESEETPST